MKLITLTTLAATATAFAPPPKSRPPSRHLSAVSAKVPSFPKIPNPYKNLPWNIEREQEREKRDFEYANAKMFRQLGLPIDATYEDVKAKTDFLIELYKDDIKKRIPVEIARDKIYMIRLNERIAGVTSASDEARMADLIDERGIEGVMEMDDSIDQYSKPKFELRIPIVSGLMEYLSSVYRPPDEKWAKRQSIIWGLSTLFCLINPPLTENFARVNWLAAGGMMGYRGMPGMENKEPGYNPFRGKRNKVHQVQAMGIAIFVWVMAKALAENFVMKVPAMVASRSCEWFKFAIVQAMLGLSCSYIQTYKGEGGKELMI